MQFCSNRELEKHFKPYPNWAFKPKRTKGILYENLYWIYSLQNKELEKEFDKNGTGKRLQSYFFYGILGKN